MIQGAKIVVEIIKCVKFCDKVAHCYDMFNEKINLLI